MVVAVGGQLQTENFDRISDSNRGKMVSVIMFFISALIVPLVRAHGNLNLPPSSRQGVKGKITPGSLLAGGYCEQPWGNESQPFSHNVLNGYELCLCARTCGDMCIREDVC